MAKPGSSSMEIEEEEKMKDRDAEIINLLNIVDIIITYSGVHQGQIMSSLGNKIINMEYSDDIAGTLMTVFTCLRKEENDKSGFNRYLGYTSNVSDAKISIKDIVDKIKEAGIKLNFLVATPIVEIMTLFKASFDEVRTGVTRFRVRSTLAKKTVKRDAQGKVIQSTQTKEATQNITGYGLTNHHIPLLQGITFAPERRTGVLRSIGPLAQAILLVMEDKYHSKLTSALYNSIMMLPMAQEVVNVLRDAKTPGSVSGILKELGDILLITTARSTQKIYFPLLMVYAMWKLKKPETFSWSFSGAHMMKFYSSLVDDGWQIEMRTGGDANKCAEVLFHAMFGTYLEDLSILSQITSNKATWHKRKDLNQVLEILGNNVYKVGYNNESHKRHSEQMFKIPIKNDVAVNYDPVVDDSYYDLCEGKNEGVQTFDNLVTPGSPSVSPEAVQLSVPGDSSSPSSSVEEVDDDAMLSPSDSNNGHEPTTMSPESLPVSDDNDTDTDFVNRQPRGVGRWFDF